MLQHLHAGLGRAGRKALPPAHKQSRIGSRSTAIHILLRGQAGADFLLHRRQFPRQGPQDQAAVDAAVGIDLVDQVKQFLPPHR